MEFAVTFIALSFLGILNTSYLIFKEKQETLVCPLNSDCKAVLNSDWNKFLGIKNEYLGLAYYLLTLGLILFYIFGKFGAVINPQFLIIITGGGALYSLYLTGIQVIKIKNYCLYCLASCLISVLLFINSLALV